MCQLKIAQVRAPDHSDTNTGVPNGWCCQQPKSFMLQKLSRSQQCWLGGMLIWVLLSKTCIFIPLSSQNEGHGSLQTEQTLGNFLIFSKRWLFLALLHFFSCLCHQFKKLDTLLSPPEIKSHCFFISNDKSLLSQPGQCLYLQLLSASTFLMDYSVSRIVLESGGKAMRTPWRGAAMQSLLKAATQVSETQEVLKQQQQLYWATSIPPSVILHTNTACCISPSLFSTLKGIPAIQRWPTCKKTQNW